MIRTRIPFPLERIYLQRNPQRWCRCQREKERKRKETCWKQSCDKNKNICGPLNMYNYVLKETIIGGVGVKERQAASSETKRALGQKWQLARGGDQLALMLLWNSCTSSSLHCHQYYRHQYYHWYVGKIATINLLGLSLAEWEKESTLNRHCDAICHQCHPPLLW